MFARHFLHIFFKRFQFLVRCFSLTNDQVQNGFCPGPYMVTSDQAFFLRQTSAGLEFLANFSQPALAKYCQITKMQSACLVLQLSSVIHLQPRSLLFQGLGSIFIAQHLWLGNQVLYSLHLVCVSRCRQDGCFYAETVFGRKTKVCTCCLTPAVKPFQLAFY